MKRQLLVERVHARSKAAADAADFARRGEWEGIEGGHYAVQLCDCGRSIDQTGVEAFVGGADIRGFDRDQGTTLSTAYRRDPLHQCLGGYASRLQAARQAR